MRLRKGRPGEGEITYSCQLCTVYIKPADLVTAILSSQQLESTEHKAKKKIRNSAKLREEHAKRDDWLCNEPFAGCLRVSSE